MLLVVVEICMPKFDEEKGLLLALATNLTHNLQEAKVEQLLLPSIVSLLLRFERCLILEEINGRLLDLLRHVVDLVEEAPNFLLALQFFIIYFLLVCDVFLRSGMVTDYFLADLHDIAGFGPVWELFSHLFLSVIAFLKDLGEEGCSLPYLKLFMWHLPGLEQLSKHRLFLFDIAEEEEILQIDIFVII